jgi:tetratricopeptide (TPR) repeat protein
VAFTLAPVVLLALLVEGGLALFGVQPQLNQEDPFVGFVSSIRLFVESTDAEGRPIMVTGNNKRGFFNLQQFAVPKAPDTYRIFCLGGSTTYGRPYADVTSFCGWLRELLPVAQPGRRWEVINAGGISYASYRVARLMEELVNYEPDLFVVYTGHNEFLEERSYGSLRDLPAPVKSTVALLARTRTWTVLNSLAGQLRSAPAQKPDTRSLLPNEVQAKLDHSAGPALFERDDALQDGILAHYRFSLRRMTQMARSVDASILFVSPASNLRNCSPFKSQHSDRLDEQARSRVEKMSAEARELMDASRWTDALAVLDEAVGIDPRNAKIHYRRGVVLLALDRADEAVAALRQARDEDVCPLRALSSMQTAALEVARETGAMLVDYPELLRRRVQSERGHDIPGEDYFLDHVHPTIEGHRLLAVAIMEELAGRGVLQPDAAWGDAAIARVADRVERSLDKTLHARALANLALTLDWAGKTEESNRLAMQALESGEEDPTILMIAARHQAMAGRSDEALGLFRRALRANPGNPVVHSQLGLLLAGRQELEAAAAHFFLASLIWADNEVYHQQLGFIMGQRGRHATALASLMEARRLNPQNPQTEARIASIRAQLGQNAAVVSPLEVSVDRYPSGYPRTIAQTRAGSDGHPVTSGIWTEWYDGGGLKRFMDYEDGNPHGVAVEWDESGEVISSREYRHGAPIGAPEGA